VLNQLSPTNDTTLPAGEVGNPVAPLLAVEERADLHRLGHGGHRAADLTPTARASGILWTRRTTCGPVDIANSVPASEQP
jgi:hypothetical protein